MNASQENINRERALPTPSEVYWPWELSQEMFQTPRAAVMFDIIAASYNIIYLSRKAQELYVTTKEAVEDSLAQIPDALLMGEIDDARLHAKLKNRFVATNSPRSIRQVDVTGKTVILISNNGTHTLAELLTLGAHPVYVGHYANLHALLTALKKQNNELSTVLVPSGGRETVYRDNPKLFEDNACALAVQKLLRGEDVRVEDDFLAIRQWINDHPVAGGPHPQTLALLLQADIFDIVPVCRQQADNLIRIVVKEQ